MRDVGGKMGVMGYELVELKYLNLVELKYLNLIVQEANLRNLMYNKMDMYILAYSGLQLCMLRIEQAQRHTPVARYPLSVIR